VAEFIHANGNEATVHPLNKEKGFSLHELYTLIHCSTVQAITLADGRTMWMDEEAKLHAGLSFVNEKATKLLAEAGGIPGDEVIGNVLITGPGEVE
jgi:hypothetical protein